MIEAIKPARWTYAVYGPKTFGLGEVGGGAFFHLRCVYGDVKLEANIQAMEFIREASRVHHETGLTPRQLVEQRDVLAKALLQTTDVYEAMRSKLAEMYPQDGWSVETMTIDQARAALALVKGVKDE